METSPSLLEDLVADRTDQLAELFIERVPKGHMSDNTFFKKRPGPDPFGPINNLLWHHKIPRLNLLPQTPHCTERNNRAHTDGPQGGNVRPTGDLAGMELVVQAMPREKGYGVHTVWSVQDCDGRGGIAPRRPNVKDRNCGET